MKKNYVLQKYVDKNGFFFNMTNVFSEVSQVLHAFTDSENANSPKRIFLEMYD